ncbi:MAG: hypothetical protein FD130_1307 [Halothiobacillaceae bacterium]|nr:MAG: hypothetical protein FD130_1307 [Halothiobacillaceae bacterium]
MDYNFIDDKEALKLRLMALRIEHRDLESDPRLKRMITPGGPSTKTAAVIPYKPITAHPNPR